MNMNKNGLGSAIKDELSWGKTWNGADCKVTAGNYCLDLFGRGGSLREATHSEKVNLMLDAFNEDALTAMKLLFYIRDCRDGYGERDTFYTMVRAIADKHTDSLVKNLWAFMEFGYGKDLYRLIGTKAEEAMWEFMADKFVEDVANLKAGKEVSLLAKWIATPDASSAKTKALGIQTAKKLGYDFKTMREYKNILRELRKKINIVEAKMCAQEWGSIDYNAVPSKCMLKSKEAFKRHDEDRFNNHFDKVNKGEAKVNTAVLTPVDVLLNDLHKGDTDEVNTIWNNLPDKVDGNVLVMCDTSGSMSWSSASTVAPITVATAMTIYLAERNKGDLKNLAMTFETTPHWIHIKGSTLREKYNNLYKENWGGSTNLEGAFDALLNLCISNKIQAEDMPNAIMVISDMQINSCARGYSGDRMTFYDRMAKRYANAGYEMPQLVFWNVNASSPAFHATKDTRGASLVSGWSANICKQVLESIGTTPYELMMSVVNSERYSKITV